MFWDTFYSMCLGAGKSPNRVAKELGIPSGSVTMWKKGSTPPTSTNNKNPGTTTVPGFFFIFQRFDSFLCGYLIHAPRINQLVSWVIFTQNYP